ncbi:hypothetical protein PSEUDO8Z_160313 [Pseudomonas sp. 8Z]|uniref:DUF4376 domain-containing protein n=1 Tax=Pseudomonas sp. 8Z TaxID=2653166 RepID=UPI0012F34271|nr:DUF4376 domain-containing protein [Pseudomonas sp. 8Z]VXC71607.1 hypothetical protein PSEUDO8Z_160313 [Pseudomonas sp. 8Z]
MEYFFCAATRGLYPGNATGDAIGQPVVKITKERYIELAGKQLDVDEDGNPIEFVPPSFRAGAADVDAERDRRIDGGIEFQGVTFQSRATDRENIAGAAQLGFMAVVSGAQPGDLRWSNADVDFAWIASDNSLVPMDAQTVVAFGKAAAERKQALIFAARQLKDMESIPADYTDDKWWP